MCVVNVASYDNYMLINSYLTFCFLLFAFFDDNLIAIRCIHPKNSNHRRSHLRAIIALDHSRLGLENEFTEKTNQAEFFAFDKST